MELEVELVELAELAAKEVDLVEVLVEVPVGTMP